MTSEEGFLSRWNRRKVEAKAAPAARQPERPAVPDAGPPVSVRPADAVPPDMLRDDPPDEETRAAWIAQLEDVDLEALAYKDDFTVFLRSWVPQALRNKALKRLWRTSDVFEVLDGLAEYDEDYSVSAAFGSVKTDWNVGRGYAGDEVEETETEGQDVEEVETEAIERQPAVEQEQVADAGENDSPADDGGSDDEAAKAGEAKPGG